MIQPIILEKPALTVIGMETSFLHALSSQATNLKEIGALWERFLHRARLVSNHLSTASYGIVYERPESQRSHPDELQYIAGVAVSSTAEVPAGMVAYSVPAGTFAVFTHRGPIHRIGETMHTIYRVWLPQSAYRHAHTADVEVYDQRFHADSADSEMEYWVPVVEMETGP
jgi:AraC family transcriptional regulator